MIARVIIALTSLCFACTALACERPPSQTRDAPKTSAPEETSARATSSTTSEDAAPPPDLPEGVFAQGDGITLKVEEFEHTLRRGILLAPDEVLKNRSEIPTRQLKVPHIQSSAARSIIYAALAKRDAAARGIEVSASEIDAFLAKNPRLSRFSPHGKITLQSGETIDKTLDDLGMSMVDVEALAREYILAEKLEQALADEITEEEVWDAYQYAHDQVDAYMIRLDNSPTSDEIDAFVRNHPDRIQARFQERKRHYRPPRLSVLTTLRLPPDTELSESARIARLKKAAQRMRDEDPQVVADTMGLDLTANERMVRKEAPRAFQAEKGETGVSVDAPRGTYAWRVTEIIPSKEATLTTPLKREIASELIRAEGRSETVQRKAQTLLKNLRDLKTISSVEDPAITRGVPDAEVRVRRPGPISRRPDGFVLDVGVNKELQNKLFALTEERPVIDEPVVTPSHIWLARLAERTRPSREAFEAKKSEHIATFKESVRGDLFKRLAPELRERYNMEVDLGAIRDAYGVYDKERGE